ncbi:MAG: hypothetical protein P8J87_21245 [Verrucomicrobiales bacterium]|nr:hypothetical protein [Verrucomicrobiales bacterium]
MQVRAIEARENGTGWWKWVGCLLAMTVGGAGWAMRSGIERLYESTVTVEVGEKFDWEEAVLALDDGEVLGRLGKRFLLLPAEAELLGERVDVTEAEGDDLFNVTVTWNNPGLAADLANALVNVYDEVRREAFVEGTRREMAKRIEAQKEEVEEARVRLLEAMERMEEKGI